MLFQVTMKQFEQFMKRTSESDMQSAVKIGKQNVHVGVHVMTTLVDHQRITCESRVLILLKGFEWKESLRFSPCFFTVNEVAGGY